MLRRSPRQIHGTRLLELIPSGNLTRPRQAAGAAVEVAQG